MSFQISSSPRVRRSPFFDSTVADGVTSFTSYNHMLMPTSYGDPVAEYERLIHSVAMWDVAVERQVEISGPDAAELVRVLTPRKLQGLYKGMGWYVPLCDHRGVVINDPILLKLCESKFWYSIADSDMLFWVRAIAAERGFDVEVCEPDVSPLAIQGPLAEDVTAKLLGEEIRSIRRFQFTHFDLNGIPLIVARSGWSHQGGFELYLCNAAKGNDLWALVKEAGKEFGIGPGTPNPQERIESGLLSWGGDTDDQTNPFELGLDRYVDLDVADDVVGIQALRRIRQNGVQRHQLGLSFHNGSTLSLLESRQDVMQKDKRVGFVSAVAWSPRLNRNIGLSLLDRDVAPGDEVTISLSNGQQQLASVCKLPFI